MTQSLSNEIVNQINLNPRRSPTYKRRSLYAAAAEIRYKGCLVGGADEMARHDRHSALSALLPRLFAFARTLLADVDAARDIVQEAAAHALAAVRVPDEPAAYRAWMFRIVRNAALDELRRRRPTDIDDPVSVDVWRYDDARIAKITVEQGLAQIGSEHREIISLIDIAGFSYAEAAGLLGVPVGTVMSRLARAREGLLAAIDSSAVRPLKARHG